MSTRRVVVTCAAIGVAVALALALALAAPAGSTVVDVPGDFATIQGAIDSGADTVRVADGVYPEDLTIARSLHLVTRPPVHPYDPPPFPEVGALRVNGTTSLATVRIDDFHFRGAVRTSLAGAGADAHLTFEACRMDSGLVPSELIIVSGTRVDVRSCLIFGGATLRATHIDFTGNSVIGGGLTMGAEESGAIRGNYLAGPAAAGIHQLSSDADLFEIEDNVVVGASEGFVVDGSTGLYGVYHDNTVTDCSGAAFRVFAPALRMGPTLVHNTVRRCGGHGFELSNVVATVDRNDVEDVGLDGIHAPPGDLGDGGIFTGNRIVRPGGAGIRLEAAIGTVAGNVVLEAGSDGIVVAGPSPVDHNVVGRCGGDGVRVTVGDGATVIESNTAYRNGGDGFEVVGTGSPASVHHNISFDNDGAGFRWSGAGSPALGCNDWRDDAGGATAGVAAGATDLDLEPGFCNVAADSVTLAVDAPLADAPGCGLVGALGVGCGVRIDVDGDTSVRPAALVAWPRPAPGVVHFSWPALAEPSQLEVFDASGRRRWRTGLEPRATEADWHGADDHGRSLPAGIYLARLLGGGRVLSARIVRTR